MKLESPKNTKRSNGTCNKKRKKFYSGSPTTINKKMIYISCYITLVNQVKLTSGLSQTLCHQKNLITFFTPIRWVNLYRFTFKSTTDSIFYLQLIICHISKCQNFCTNRLSLHLNPLLTSIFYLLLTIGHIFFFFVNRISV